MEPTRFTNELRIKNTLTDEGGKEVRLKQGATVEITVAAEPQAVSTKNDKACASTPVG